MVETFKAQQIVTTEHFLEMMDYPNDLVYFKYTKTDSSVFDGVAGEPHVWTQESCYYKPSINFDPKNPWKTSSNSHKQLQAITQKEYDQYKVFDIEHLKLYDENEKLLKETLDRGDFHLIIRNHFGYDHMISDFQGNWIPRRVKVDYINGQIQEGSYDLRKVKEHLEKCPGVTNLKVITIPYYNQDFSGQKAIEFDWDPADAEDFTKAIRNFYLDAKNYSNPNDEDFKKINGKLMRECHSVCGRTLAESLGCEQFRIPEKDNYSDLTED